VNANPILVGGLFEFDDGYNFTTYSSDFADSVAAAHAAKYASSTGSPLAFHPCDDEGLTYSFTPGIYRSSGSELLDCSYAKTL
jgi:hypothetical protein